VAVRDEAQLVSTARAGDEEAFRRLAAPYLRELHVHCYRMLGSFHDAEDALQETLLRAWRGLQGFEGRSSPRVWLYRIATNACLTALERRTRHRPAPPPELGAGSGGRPPSPLAEAAWLEPYPDALLDEVPHEAVDPQARYDLRESVALAFVAALQLLPVRQRSALLLRDVLGWSAAEIADALGTSVAAVNSALQRARSTLDGKLAGPASWLAPPDATEQALVRRFLDAWESADIEGLAALFTEDAVLAMPPVPVWYAGPAAIARFFASAPAGGPIDRMPLVPARANRQPLLAAYGLDRDTRVYRAYGLMALCLDGERIAALVGFAKPELFPAFGLAQELGGGAPSSVHGGAS
jgi:RNA polymerase sigma-70 factor (TIGR02960 family)